MSSPPTFAAWDIETLARFALDAYLKLQEQHDLIQQLTVERKDAIAAYRALNTKIKE